jgi:hypothetical protein
MLRAHAPTGSADMAFEIICMSNNAVWVMLYSNAIIELMTSIVTMIVKNDEIMIITMVLMVIVMVILV